MAFDFQLAPLPLTRYFSTSFSYAHNAPVSIIEQLLERLPPARPHLAHESVVQ